VSGTEPRTPVCSSRRKRCTLLGIDCGAALGFRSMAMDTPGGGLGRSDEPAVGTAPLEVFWRPGCPYCSGLRRELARRQVPATWRNIWDDPAARDVVRSVNSGSETVPTARIGTYTLTNPSWRQLAPLLGDGPWQQAPSSTGRMKSVASWSPVAVRGHQPCLDLHGSRRRCVGGRRVGRGVLVADPWPTNVSSPLMASDRRSPSRMARIAARPGGVARPWWLPASLAVLVAGADLASKQWALAHLGAAGSSHSGRQLAVVANRGAAWGLGSSAPLLIGIVEAFGVVLLGWWLVTRTTSAERVCLAVVLGGATANLIERVGRGAVTD